MILRRNISNPLCQTKLYLVAMIEYYRDGCIYLLNLEKRASIKKLSTPVQKALHLHCFWTLSPYLLLQVCPVVAAEMCHVDLQVRRNSSQCLHMLEMPAQLQEHLNALLRYIQSSKNCRRQPCQTCNLPCRYWQRKPCLILRWICRK